MPGVFNQTATPVQAEPYTTPVVSNGWVSAEGMPDYQQSMGPKMYQAAQELAKNLEPPDRASMAQLQQMLFGSVQGYGDEQAKLKAQALSRHFVSPPVSGGGRGMEPVTPALLAATAKQAPRRVRGLGEILRGG